MFKPTSPLLGGLLWKIPWRLSAPQKRRQRKRLKAVDKVVDTVATALRNNNLLHHHHHHQQQHAVGGRNNKASSKMTTSTITSTRSIERWYSEMPREEEMLPKDKYTIFDRKAKNYRKGIHKLPKWTRISQRVNPPGF